MDKRKEETTGTVYFVGAGPGDPDLITLRGKKLLTIADCIIYAGSLVNPQLLSYARPACRCYNSAALTLEEILHIMCKEAAQGHCIVRLHTGDPSLYGAIREQIAGLRQAAVPFFVIPGVSSFTAAAAAMAAEYTVPGISQSVIITRYGGRTPVPERQEIHNYATHTATMVIFLSAGYIPQVQDELLQGGYAKDTPAAIVYKVSRADEKILSCTVGSLAATGRKANITHTALILVGHFLGAVYERSCLYNPSFTHAFRKGDKEGNHG